MSPAGVLLAGLEFSTVVAGGFAAMERATRNRWAADWPPRCCGTVEWTGARPFGQRAADDSWWSCLGCGDFGYVEDGKKLVVGRFDSGTQAGKVLARLR